MQQRELYRRTISVVAVPLADGKDGGDAMFEADAPRSAGLASLGEIEIDGARYERVLVLEDSDNLSWELAREITAQSLGLDVLTRHGEHQWERDHT